MPRKLRSLIGLICILIFLGCYLILLTAIAPPILIEAGAAKKFVFYAIGGLAWVIPVGALMKWMQRPDNDGDPNLNKDG